MRGSFSVCRCFFFCIFGNHRDCCFNVLSFVSRARGFLAFARLVPACALHRVQGAETDMARVAELCKMSDKGYAASMVVTNRNKKVHISYFCPTLSEK